MFNCYDGENKWHYSLSCLCHGHKDHLGFLQMPTLDSQTTSRNKKIYFNVEYIKLRIDMGNVSKRQLSRRKQPKDTNASHHSEENPAPSGRL